MEKIVLEARSRVGENKDELLAASHEIHGTPELRFEEYKASALLCEILSRHGFAVEQGLAGMPTAFRATFSVGSGGPSIAVFSEYDALAGVGHACGHNIIATAGVGAAIAAAEMLASMDEVNGTVVCLGSPGEEGGGGKVRLIDAGELAGLDAAVMIHPAGDDDVTRPNLGRLSLEVTFTGKASHAASAPEMGLNALDATTLFLVATGLLRQQLRADSRVHAIVLEGGEAVNVIPERSRLRVFVRSPDPAYLQERLLQSIYDIASGSALASGTSVEVVETAPAYQSMNSNSIIADVCFRAFLALGRRPLDPHATVSETSSAGSTDMGNVSRILPSVHAYVGIAPGVAGHTREFEKAAASSAGDAAVLDGAAILATALVELVTDPDLLASAKEEFNRGAFV